MSALGQWLAMGGYGYYVWSAYGMLALALLLELRSLRRRRRDAAARARSLRDEAREDESQSLNGLAG